jgi:hypothetical protein
VQTVAGIRDYKPHQCGMHVAQRVPHLRVLECLVRIDIALVVGAQHPINATQVVAPSLWCQGVHVLRHLWGRWLRQNPEQEHDQKRESTHCEAGLVPKWQR